MKLVYQRYFFPEAEERQALDMLGQRLVAGLRVQSMNNALSANERNRTDLASALVTSPDGQTQAGRFAWHQAYVSGWTDIVDGRQKFGIGPIRTIYYLQILEGPFHDPDSLNIGGFPPASYPVKKKSHITKDGDLITAADKMLSIANDEQMRRRDWIVHDLHLSKILADLGLSWAEVEEAVTASFVNNLPEFYRRLLEGSPTWACFSIWRHDLERWQQTKTYRKRLTNAVKALEGLIEVSQPAITSQIAPVLRNLRAIPGQPWLQPRRGLMEIEDDLASRCRISSPLAKAVTKAVYEMLWLKLDLKRKPPWKSPARAIWLKRYENDSVRPKEVWMLIADIVNHIRIARGLPGGLGQAQPAGSSFLTMDAVRQIVTEQYERNYSRSHSTLTRTAD